MVAAGAVLVLAGGTGCTGGTGADPEPTPATPPPAATGPETSPTGGPPQFPATPQEYAERAVAAWAAPDLLRLAELAAPEVQRELIELPGPPELTWRFIRCEAGAGQSDCAFHNRDGDRLVLTVDHQLLAEPRAAVAVALEGTRYPADPLRYVQAFVAAWQDGNLGRMQRLALPGAVEVYAQLEPPPQVGYEVGERGGPLVEVVVRAAPAGEVRTALSTGLLGQPQAIRTASLDPATG